MSAEIIHLHPDRPRVDITPGFDGYRVWLLGTLYAEFKTSTNAARCASALMTLDALDCLPQRPSVQEMLAASVDDLLAAKQLTGETL